MLFKKKKIQVQEISKDNQIGQPTQEEKPIETDKKLGLNEQVKQINEKIDILAGIKKKKPKEMKLRGFKKSRIKQWNRKNKRACLMLYENGYADLIKGQYTEGMIDTGEEKFRDGSALGVWLFKGKFPLYIYPNNSIQPIDRDSLFKKVVDTGNAIYSQTITLRRMQQQESDKNKGFKMGGFGMWIGIAIAAVVLAWLIFGGK